MRYFLAILCGLAVVAAQTMYGGAMRPVFALPAYAVVGIVGILAVAGAFWRNLPAPNAGCVVSVGLLAGWMLWRTEAAADVWLASGFLRLILACVVLYGVFAWVITHPFHRLAFCVVILASALAQAALGAWQFTHHHEGFPIPWMSRQLEGWYGGRFSDVAHGMYLNRNHLAWFLNAAGLIGLALSCWGRWRIGLKILCFYVAVMSLAGSVLTGSRGGILGLAVGLIVFCICSAGVLIVGAKGRRGAATMAILGGLAFTAAGIFFVFQNSFFVQGRFQILFDDSYREGVFEAVLRQFQLAPLGGTGPGTFMYYARQFRESQATADDLFAHNDWMQVTADFGFPALALLLVVVILHVSNGWRGLMAVLRSRMSIYTRPQSHSAALLIAALTGLAAFAVHSLFDFNMQIPANALLAAALLGILANPGAESRPQHRAGLFGSIRRAPAFLVLGVLAGWLAFEVWQVAGSEYHVLRAENAVLKGDWQEALRELDRGQVTEIVNPRLLELRGKALLLRSFSRSSPADRWGDAREAVQELSTAAALAPGDWYHHLQLLEALMRTGQLREAEREAFVAIRLNPTHGRAYELYAQILESRGEYPAALRFYLLSRGWPGSTLGRDGIKGLQNKIQDANERKASSGKVFP